MRHRRRARSALPSDTKKRAPSPTSSCCSRNIRTPISSSAARRSIDLVLRHDPRRDQAGEIAFDCRIIASFPTTIQPMRGLVDKIMALEGKDACSRSRSATAFPRRRAGMRRAHPRAHRRRQGKGDKLAERIGGALIALRERPHRPWSRSTGRSTSLLSAMAARSWSPTPPTIPAAARPETTPVFLHRLIARRAGAAVAPIWDPIAVRYCFDAGAGARLAFRFGGKTQGRLGNAGRCRGRGARAG